MDRSTATNTWRISSDSSQVARVRVGVEEFCRAHGMAADAVANVGLCVNEAVANVIRHAYAGAADGEIVVQAERVGERVVVTVRDWGSGEAPAELPEEKKDPLRPGGLGLVCLRRLMDRVEFVKQADGMLLRMEKTL